jgi:hypothetical protein
MPPLLLCRLLLPAAGWSIGWSIWCWLFSCAIVISIRIQLSFDEMLKCLVSPSTPGVAAVGEGHVAGWWRAGWAGAEGRGAWVVGPVRWGAGAAVQGAGCVRLCVRAA